jgi:hypothetical protein
LALAKNAGSLPLLKANSKKLKANHINQTNNSLDNMNIRNIALILFLLAAAGTILIHFRYDNDRLFWTFGIVAAVFYLIFRFSKRQK